MSGRPSSAGEEASLGRALALLALAPLATREADEREREEREEREEEEAIRRSEVRAQLGRTAKREWWLVVTWNAVWAVALIGGSLALTFTPPNADLVVATKAAWSYLWLPLSISAGIVLVACTAYNVFRFRAGKPALGVEASFLDFALLGLALPGVFVYSAARSGAVPPSAWSWAPFVVATAFLAAILIRVLSDRIAKPNRVKLSVLLLVVSLLSLTWLSAPRSDVPSRASQRDTDRRLIAATPIAHCTGIPISSLPLGLFRNSLDGLIRCRQHGLRGKILAFRSSELLEVYASQQERGLRRSAGNVSENCAAPSGIAIRAWVDHDDQSVVIGKAFCRGVGGRATIEWTDLENSTFAKVRGKSRASLHGWWKRGSWRMHRRLTAVNRRNDGGR